MKIEIDKFNSEIFSMKMGNVYNIRDGTTDEDIVSMIEEARGLGFQHLYAKISTSDVKNATVFIKNGFELVDPQLMYCRENISGGYKQTVLV